MWPGGGTGMNGALHAQIEAATTSVAARRAMRRTACFIGGVSPVQGISKARSGGRPAGRAGSGAAPSTWLARGATGLSQSGSCEAVPLQLLLQTEAGEAEQVGGLGLVVPGAAERLADQRSLEALHARLDEEAVRVGGL